MMKRFFFFLTFDTGIMVVSLYVSFLIYFEMSNNIRYASLMREVLPYFILTKLAAFGLLRVYRITWRYFGITDLFNLITALTGANVFLLGLSLLHAPTNPRIVPLLAPVRDFPKSIVFMDFTICLVLLCILRILKRFYLEVIRERSPAAKLKRTIIVGAGNTGEMVVRDMVRQGFSEFRPVALVDDDDAKLGTFIHGIEVVGRLQRLADVIVHRRAQAVIIAIPNLDRRTLRRLFDDAKAAKVDVVKTVPRIYNFSNPYISLKNLEDISVEDLIGRQIVRTDTEATAAFLHGKSVLVTGAGGSIGSEIVNQICAFQPADVVLLDIDETELHNLHFRLKRIYGDASSRISYVVGDIRDRARIDRIFASYRPKIVFHAAAYKHVPMMEHNCEEAVKVNMFGTYFVATAARRHGCEKFIMISTDKAVRPTSVMGATKRMAEQICGALDNERRTRFVSVRFGNVLGSRGSVLPLFFEQLKYGESLTITHPEMKRYFMTIPEAVSLVLQASILGKGGDVLVLDMGEPVNILEMAEELIRINGLEPYKDVDIEFVGLRPGEKLFEEILTAEEGTDATKHEKIFVARNGSYHTVEHIENILSEFDRIIKKSLPDDDTEVRDLLRKYVHHYRVEPEATLAAQPEPEPRAEHAAFAKAVRSEAS
jgi:FlaA1/EpsC-like NDP-sugar epimerase